MIGYHSGQMWNANMIQGNFTHLDETFMVVETTTNHNINWQTGTHEKI